jgi:hypothetical protein
MNNFSTNRSGHIRVKSTKMKSDVIFKLFGDIEGCIEALVELDILPETKTCIKCNLISRLCIKEDRGIKRIIYRCTDYVCSAKVSINKGSKLFFPTFCELIFAILCRWSYF